MNLRFSLHFITFSPTIGPIKPAILMSSADRLCLALIGGGGLCTIANIVLGWHYAFCNAVGYTVEAAIVFRLGLQLRGLFSHAQHTMVCSFKLRMGWPHAVHADTTGSGDLGYRGAS